MYVRADGSRPSAAKDPEKPPKDPKALAAARLLEACDLNFLLMWGKRSAGTGGRHSELDRHSSREKFALIVEIDPVMSPRASTDALVTNVSSDL